MALLYVILDVRYVCSLWGHMVLTKKIYTALVYTLLISFLCSRHTASGVNQRGLNVRQLPGVRLPTKLFIKLWQAIDRLD